MKPRMILWHPRCPTCGVVEDEPLLVLPPHVDFRAPGDIGPWEKQRRRKQRQISDQMTAECMQALRREQDFQQYARQSAGNNPFGMPAYEQAQQRRSVNPWWPFS